ncbi:MAG: NADH-quinone oxidoreductase subunit M [Candidatus Aminicenantes bacterium]|nr:NADH-quinone oxidoreductase subunit M [Candidatus Aminicenantes bacterium]
MNIAGIPILTFLIFFPLVGIFLMLLLPSTQQKWIKWAANIITALEFLFSLLLLNNFNSAAEGMQFMEKASWIKSLNVQYLLGIDGISLLLILLTTLLTFLATLSSWSAVKDRLKEYYIFLLLLEVGMVGVFVSLDFILFYVFWELMLVPMYFLIGIWGGERKLYAAIKFFLYTLFGSVMMLVAILVIYFNYHTFDVMAIMETGKFLPMTVQSWVFLAFFLGFAIKVPMFPFHTWLPDAHVEAPTAGSVLLAGILLKMGAYGFVRFSLPLFPEACKKYMPMVIALALISIVYGALVSLMQKDMKKLIAYSSVSHMGFVMLGIFVFTPMALKGAIIQMINHGISTGALFLIVGVVYERRHTRLIADFGGLSSRMPVYAAVFLIITMSSIGLPGLNGFIGEFMILMGTFPVNFYWAMIAATGIILGAAYMLWLYQRVMFGKLENPANQALSDLNLREFAVFTPLILMAFWIGVAPKPFLNVLDKPVEKIIRIVNPDYYNKPALEIKKMEPAQTHEPGTPATAGEGETKEEAAQGTTGTHGEN